jgi:hypothetical protein
MIEQNRRLISAMGMQQNKQGPGSILAGGRAGPQMPWADTTKYVSSTFYVYEVDTVNLNTQQSAQLSFNIAGDSDFFWTKFCAFALIDATATTRADDQLPAVTALIINTTTGRQYSSAPVPLPNYAGNAQFPFILPVITQWEKKSTIQINLFNEGDSNYSNLQLSFIGVKAMTQSN